jgi:hypothetical protein
VVFRFSEQSWIVDRLRPMRIVYAHHREAVDRKLPRAGRIPDGTKKRRDVGGLTNHPVNLHATTSDGAQLGPVATAYHALYMG